MGDVQVSVPLGTIIRGFPPREQMHPFEQALVLLTIGPEAYERRLVQVDALRRSTLEVCPVYSVLACVYVPAIFGTKGSLDVYGHGRGTR